MPRKIYRRKVVRRPYKKRAVRRSTVSKNVKKYVKKAIHSQIENKVVCIEQGTTFFGNYANDPAMRCFPMTPYTSLFSIPLGVTNGNRVGNTIKTRKVMLNYVLVPVGFNSTFNTTPVPCHVQLFLGNMRQQRGVLPVAIDFTVLFDTGGSASAPAGNLSDLLQPINKDYWDIKKQWSHKLGFAINPNSGVSTANASYSNNDFAYNVVRKMDITKYCPKTVKFNDSGQTNQGSGLFFFYQALSAQGTTLASSQTPMSIKYWVTYMYEDA